MKTSCFLIHPFYFLKYTCCIALCVFALGCKRDYAEYISPLSSFDGPFPKKNKQLSKIFGEELVIKRENDTLYLKIISTKDENIFLNAKSGDTIFRGKVCKYREFYYLSKKLDDTSYYISAFAIKGNLLYGIRRGAQYYAIDEQILSGNGRGLLKYINSDSSYIRLRPNKKEMRKLFGVIMSQVVPDTLLDSSFDLKEIERKDQAVEIEPEDLQYKFKLFPNPATDYILIQANKPATFKLVDFNGNIVLQGALPDQENRIDLTGKKSGVYIISIEDAKGKQLHSEKVIIQ